MNEYRPELDIAAMPAHQKAPRASWVSRAVVRGVDRGSA